ncbi:hypothetical protein ACOMHN_046628 [Nucella lapillus]
MAACPTSRPQAVTGVCHLTVEFPAIPKWWMKPLEASTREPVQLFAALLLWQVVSKESDEHHDMVAQTLAVVLAMVSLALQWMLLAVLELVVLADLELVVLSDLELVVLGVWRPRLVLVSQPVVPATV